MKETKEKLRPCDYKHYSNYSLEEKKKLRALMQSQKEKIKAQRDLIENSIMKAYKERLDLIDKFLHNEVHVEYYVKRQTYLGKYIASFFKDTGKKLEAEE